MKKILVALLVLILLVAGGIAGGMYWFGQALESGYQQALQQVGNQSGMILKSTGFTSGFMASQANTLVMIPGANVTGTADHEIAPGPVNLGGLLAGDIDLNPAKYVARTTVKLLPKKELSAEDKKVIASLPAAVIVSRANLLDGGTRANITVPSYKGTVDGTAMNWPQMEFSFEGDDVWGSLRLVSGSAAMKLPAAVVEDLIRVRIQLDIENLKTQRKLSPQEAKQLSPAAVKLAVENALPGYIVRYGIKEILAASRNSKQPISVSYRPGQLKVGGVTIVM
jgi:hypothetical protein